MATVPNKDGQDKGTDVHVLTAKEVLSAETPSKVRPGSPSANPSYVPVP